MERLKRHDITLRRGKITLRPMTEADWDLLLRWNNDPEVLYYSEGGDVSSRSLSEVQAIYRGMSRQGYSFIIERDGKPIGKCCFQRMNLERVITRYPGLDCWRMPIAIGEKRFWGRGIGTEVIRMLTAFGFETEGADMLFACDVSDTNPRSLKAFQRVGFEIDAEIEQPPGRKEHVVYDLVLTRERYTRRSSEEG